jgi:hypothetical protein
VIGFQSNESTLSASDTCAMLFEVYGEETMKKSIVSEWYKRFKDGCEKVQDD